MCHPLRRKHINALFEGDAGVARSVAARRETIAVGDAEQAPMLPHCGTAGNPPRPAAAARCASAPPRLSGRGAVARRITSHYNFEAFNIECMPGSVILLRSDRVLRMAAHAHPAVPPLVLLVQPFQDLSLGRGDARPKLGEAGRRRCSSCSGILKDMPRNGPCVVRREVLAVPEEWRSVLRRGWSSSARGGGGPHSHPAVERGQRQGWG